MKHIIFNEDYNQNKYYPKNGIIFFSRATSKKNLDYVLFHIKKALKKDFNKSIDDFITTYLLKTYNQHIEFKRTSEEGERYIKFNLIEQKIETGGTSEEKKTYKSLIFGRKNNDYDKQSGHIKIPLNILEEKINNV